MKRIIFFGLASVFLAGGTGCGLFHTMLYAPLGPGTLCDPEHGCCGHGPTCGADCGPACGPCASSCGPTCGPECDMACDEPCEPECGEPCGPQCGPVCHPGCGPFSLIACMFRGDYWCGTGCGEIYWGDFHGDPPDCRDPCDCYGNFTGGCAGGCAGGCTDGCTGGCTGGCVQPGVDGYVQRDYGAEPVASAPPAATRTYRLSPAAQLARTRRTTRR